MQILRPEEIRRAESAANEAGLSFESMMRAAGEGCAARIAARADRARPVAVLAGRGKNGGDGFVCAAALRRAGFRVTVILACGAPTDPIAAKMLQETDGVCDFVNARTDRAAALRALAQAGTVAEAVFGIGFRGRFDALTAELIRAANAVNAFRVAIDVPAGAGAASEEPEPFRADLTLSMLCFKPEHVYRPAAAFCGETEIVPIGFDPPAGAPFALTRAEAAALLPRRAFNAHKGDCGNLLIVGGSARMPGAAILAANGALHTGAGLVTLAVPAPCLPAAQAHLCEPVFAPLPADGEGFFSKDAAAALTEPLRRASAVALGNGIGVTPDTAALTCFVLRESEAPVILDADGINCAAAHKDIWKDVRSTAVLTPHPGEMGRLTGLRADEVNADRARTAAEFAAFSGAVVLLKGANTVIAAPDGRLAVNPTGCAAMARGGSGDTLAGVIGALAAQGLAPFDAAVLGAYVHGLAGELAERRYSVYAATAARTARCLGDAFQFILKGPCR